ncbi:MAG: CHAP domain protein [Microgenomates group bacterium ADurb.Bin219]|nr:MAG: CHAP domain protein [Microgenomates group bacterium ADurb.Bin219]HNP89148.1 CHAP domain-containing protein [Candidatus Woesebacteria bacterium]
MAEENSVKNTLDSSLQTAGRVVRFAAENVLLPIVTGGTSLATKLPKAVKALDFLRSAKPQEKEKDNTTKFVLIGIGVFFFLPIMAAITITAGFADFVGVKQIPISQKTLVKVITSPPQCQKTRHKAEEVICWLKEGIKVNSAACSQEITEVTLSNWGTTEKCLLAGPFPNSELIRNEFKKSVDLTGDYAGNLQCVGFVKGIEASIGHLLASCGNAKDFFGNGSCPDNYTKIKTADANDLKPGDLAVRNSTQYGHIGIIVETKGKTKIIVAQAWGATGQIFLSDDAVTNYQGFLRYK